MDWILNIHAPVALPSGFILLASDGLPKTQKSSDTAVTGEINENIGGSVKYGDTKSATGELVHDVLDRLLIMQGYAPDKFSLKKHDTGKPYGVLHGREVGVSITHCRSLLVCALHTRGETGIDVEPCGRKLHPALRERICHPDEQELLPDELCSVRLWTVKEAALKLLGTGLRMAMNKIRLDMTDDYLFQTTLESEPITIVSFPFQDHWIATAFEAEEIAGHSG